VQGLFGIKAGKRFNKFGVFAKARPGFVHYSRGKFDLQRNSDNTLRYTYSGSTNFATDIGGVLEFYPTKRIVTRFDAGDTIVRSNSYKTNFLDPNGNLTPFMVPATTKHYFQFNAGIGFRF
jgi:hypothetical protein